MNQIDTLKESYLQTEKQLVGHGKREAYVLQEAFQNIDGDMKSDIYGKGTVIEDFQEKMATLLGKESAVFFPSGTMAQQIALRIWCDEQGTKKVAYHPLSHLEINEEDGLKELHQIQTVLLADKNRVIELGDVLKMEKGIACLLLELPQREIGGQLPSFETLEQISSHCRKNDIKLHLDGARLLEILPYYQKTAAEVSALFDSVYISMYKGLGGIAGAILAGDHDFTEKSKVWKRRYGGDLISLYPYIIAADYYFEQRSQKMEQYFGDAKELAGYFNSCHSVSTVPEIPVSNMFHVHFYQAKEQVASVLIEVQEETGVGITGNLIEIDEDNCSFEVSLGDLYAEIPKEIVGRVFEVLNEKMMKLSLGKD